MKVWIKYLIGIALGIAAYFILPLNTPIVNYFMTAFSEFAVRFGRYALAPLLFFSASYAFFRLKDSKTFLKTFSWAAGLLLVFTLVLLALGVVSALFVELPRIPITGEKMTELPDISIKELLLQVFPFSGFDSLRDGVYLLPLFVFSAFAGFGCAAEKEIAKPVVSFLEAASKICYSILSFVVEWLSVGMIAIACNWLISTKAFFETRIFIPLTTVIFVDFLIFAVILCPLLIRILCKDPRPFHVLYASITPLLAAFFSGDTNLAMQVNMRHGRESLGIRDETNSLTFPFFSIFSRGGTALVIAICFVTILRSYSKLGIKVDDVVWLFSASFFISFILCAIPSGGTFVALTLLCTMYGRGMAAGYLLLKSAAPVLCSFAAVFDVTSAIYASYITAVKMKTIDHTEIRHYI
jgi:Na+/H+-dicarboxylate symporter